MGVAPSVFESCVCQDSILEAGFTCEYVGVLTCARSAVTTSDLLGYFCPTFSQFLSSMISKVSLLRILRQKADALRAQESVYASLLTATEAVGIQTGSAAPPSPVLPPSATSTSKSGGSKLGGDARVVLASSVLILVGALHVVTL
jgi:hypothetical protein